MRHPTRFIPDPRERLTASALGVEVKDAEGQTIGVIDGVRLDSRGAHYRVTLATGEVMVEDVE
jgi:hypothetical protein